MEFLSKTAFYVLYGMSGLAMLFFFASSAKLLLDRYGKTSEAIIMALGGIVFGTGLYFTYHLLQDSERYLHGFGALVITWVVAILVVLIGLLFFNGPLHWQ